MARPQSKGLEYYPQDTDIHSDRKIRRLRNEFGATGYMIYDYIKCLCYKENGYWVKYDDGFCFDVADFLKSGITEKLVEEVIKGCVRMSLFDKTVFNMSEIITSAGMQKRYLKVKTKGVIMPELVVMTDEMTENDYLSTQNPELVHKEKERKEKKIKEKQTAFAKSLEPFLGTYGKEMLNSFYRYWAEADKSLNNLKWELQDTWELPKRLVTWAKREFKN